MVSCVGLLVCCLLNNTYRLIVFMVMLMFMYNYVYANCLPLFVSCLYY